MNLVWHIVRKDAQLIRGPWLAWMVVQVLGLVLAGWYEYRYPIVGGFKTPYLFLMVVTWAGAYLFAALALHDDATTGATAGWITRPVSRRELLAAKAVGLVLFFWVAPAMLRLPWWLLHGYGFTETGLALLETVVIFTVITTPAFWLATLTTDAVQFYRWSLVLLGVAGIVAVSFSWIIAEPAMSRHPVIVIAVPFVGWLLATFVVSAVNQILTSRRRRSILIAAAGLAVLVMAMPGVVHMRVPAPREKAFTDEVHISLLEEVSSGLRLMALPADGLPDTLITLSDANLIDPDGTSRRLPLPVESDQRWTHIQALAAGMAGTPEPGHRGIALDAGSSAQMRGHGPQATLQVRGSAWRIEGAIALPFREGAERQGAYSLRIGPIPELRNKPQSILMAERMETISTQITETHPHLRAAFRSMGSATPVLLIANRSGIEQIELPEIFTVRVATVAIRYTRLPLRLDVSYWGTQAWREETHLVKLVLVPAGTFERTLSVRVPTDNTATPAAIP